MTNISLVKILTVIRILLWYFSILVCLLTRTSFIVQTWSIMLIVVLILNLIFCLINLFIFNYRGYHRKMKRILVIALPLLTIVTCIIYIMYMFDVYYRIMNLLTLNIMNNDRHHSLLSITLNYYKCCRVQEEILFDSTNERDYFLSFPYCEKVIEDNEMKKDHWDNITTCGSLFRSIIFYNRWIFIFDLILNFINMIVCLIYIWEETDEWIDDRQCTLLPVTNNINYKVK